MARRVAEPKQRDGSDDAGANEQDRQPPAGPAEIERAGMLEIKKENDRERDEQNCFDEQTRDRRSAGLFSQQSIKPKGEAKRNRDPREAPVTESEIQNAERSEKDGDELPARKPFAQKNRSEEHMHQGRHEIAETGFYDVPDVDRVNEEEPVGRDRESAGQAENSRAGRARIGDQLRPAALPGQNGREKNRRPNKAVRDDFRGGHRRNQFPVNGNQSPRRETRDPRDETECLVGFFGIRPLDRHPRTVATLADVARTD